jgi:hypothetical protein
VKDAEIIFVEYLIIMKGYFQGVGKSTDERRARE